MSKRVPPNDIKVESILLGLSLLDHNIAVEIISDCKEEYFFDPKHKLIFRSIQKLLNIPRSVDLVTLTELLKSENNLDSCGGEFYVEGLIDDINNTKNIDEYIRILKEKFILRELNSSVFGLSQQIFDDSANAYDILDTIQNKIISIGYDEKKSFDLIGSNTNNVLKNINERRSQKGIVGIDTGFIDINHYTAGWQNGHLIIIAGRPGQGKSRFVFNSARETAKHGNAVAIFSLEMEKNEIIQDFLVAEAGVELQSVRKGSVDEVQYQQLINVKSIIDNLPIFIDDTANISVNEIRAKARRLVKNHNVKIIFIDYLQLMETNGYKQRHIEIASISRNLKLLAKELHIPVVALSQLNRSVETRGGDKRPQLSDLRESGSIEQDADVVGFLYRPEYYEIEKHDALGIPTDGMAEFIIRKQRSGPVGTCYLYFDKDKVTFRDYNYTLPEQPEEHHDEDDFFF